MDKQEQKRVTKVGRQWDDALTLRMAKKQTDKAEALIIHSMEGGTMVTQKIDGQLEIDHDRGVIYFHSNKGYTALRIGGLPQCIPFVSPTSALDIAHMHGCSWRQPKQRAAENLKQRIRELEEELRAEGQLIQASRFFNIEGTQTGRISCKEPNIKEIPRCSPDMSENEETDDPKVAYPSQDVIVQIWSEDQEKWLDYSRTTEAASRSYYKALESGHHAMVNEQFRAISDWGNGDELWRHGYEDPREAKRLRESSKG